MSDEHDAADFHSASDLYKDWSERRNSADVPLSQSERIGLLVIDFGIRHDMGGWDGLIEDYDEALDTSEALKVVGFPELADVVRRAASVEDWHGREKAFRAIELDGIDFLFVAVARYLRRQAS